jgi:drug/metabolite transporter (DMT)-like permease
VGALGYAVTVVIGRTLAMRGFDAPTVLGLRFGVAGVIVILVLAALRRPLLPEPGERLAAFLLGAVGYAIESTFFFMGLERGSAGAVALLFYAYPAIVTVIELASGRTRRSTATFAALGLSAAGTLLIVASGGKVTITPAGAAFALLSAGCFAVYLLVSHATMRRTDSLTTAGWVALGCGVSLLARAAVTDTFQTPGDDLPLMLANGAATAVAFTCTFAALRRLGPGPTAIVLTLEAVFAVILAGIYLDETLRPAQLLGGAAVLAATAVIGLRRPTGAELEVP